MKTEADQKLYERPATPHAKKKCSECVNNCRLKNLKGNCMTHSPKKRSDNEG